MQRINKKAIEHRCRSAECPSCLRLVHLSLQFRPHRPYQKRLSACATRSCFYVGRNRDASAYICASVRFTRQPYLISSKDGPIRRNQGTYSEHNDASEDCRGEDERIVREPETDPCYLNQNPPVRTDSWAGGLLGLPLVGHPSSSENWAQSEVLRLSNSRSSM
jgi:hypothetical protein